MAEASICNLMWGLPGEGGVQNILLFLQLQLKVHKSTILRQRMVAAVKKVLFGFVHNIITEWSLLSPDFPAP